jgi:hypothetical protein
MDDRSERHERDERERALQGDIVTDTNVYRWDWSERVGGRRSLPWLGIFLVVFGGLLLLRQFFPALQVAGSLLFLAVGVAFLVSWAVNRGTGSLYAGAIITALAAPDLVEAAGLRGGPGLGTLFLGLAFLFIALVRSRSRAGIGWQAYVGLILLVLGASQIAIPGLTDLAWPVLLVLAGVLLLMGALRR